jgi:hypothetical protein
MCIYVYTYVLYIYIYIYIHMFTVTTSNYHQNGLNRVKYVHSNIYIYKYICVYTYIYTYYIYIYIYIHMFTVTTSNYYQNGLNRVSKRQLEDYYIKTHLLTKNYTHIIGIQNLFINLIGDPFCISVIQDGMINNLRYTPFQMSLNPVSAAVNLLCPS